ncbi:MAG: tyrosine-type recombinase/integrase [Phaeodactylibacter sp.]|nr:tyrosine-type recombinase/integrase [Phaeodactylibacter sp.]
MRKKRQTIYQAGGVKVHLSANGTFAIDGTIHGKRVRKRAKSQEEAELITNSLVEGRDATGVIRADLTDKEARDAEDALEILKSCSEPVTLLELAKAYQDAEQRKQSPLIVDAVWRFLGAKEHRSERTQQEMKSRLFRFSNWAKDKTLDEVSKVDAQMFLQAVPSGSFNHFLRLCKGLYIWAVEHELTGVNPFAHIKLRTREHVDVSLLSCCESKALLEASETLLDGELLAYTAICLFAGLRPDSEMRNLTWDSINLEDAEIRVTRGKTRIPRTVEMPTNLLKWLMICDKTKPIYPTNFRRKWAKIRQAAGFKGGAATTEKQRQAEKDLKPWQSDVTRHSAISNRVRQKGDINTTATWAGNSPAVIRKHYLGLVSGSESAEFWNISPRPHLTRGAC